MQEFKQHIINTCKSSLENKIHSLNTIIREVSESSNSETKSSAGDKHETGRAMMQLEQEKLGNQLREAELQLLEFNKIEFDKVFSNIIQGSLIQTNKGFFLIAVSIGKISVNEKDVFIVSQHSPLAKSFLGLTKNNSVEFNQTTYLIEEVW